MLINQLKHLIRKFFYLILGSDEGPFIEKGDFYKATPEEKIYQGTGDLYKPNYYKDSNPYSQKEIGVIKFDQYQINKYKANKQYNSEY